MKILFLIINLLINLVVSNNSSNIVKINNETEEYIDYAPEDYLNYSVVENDAEERYYYSEPLILNIDVIKNHSSISNVLILPTIIYGNVNYSLGTNVIYFNEDESSFSLQINHVAQGNSHLRLELTPSTNDNNTTPLEKTNIDIYFVGEYNFYCFSTLSLTRARQIACHYLVFDGIIEDEFEPIDEYIYQAPNAYYITSTNIDENKIKFDGFFKFQSENLNYYPADGTKVGLYAYGANNNTIYSDEIYFDEFGYFSLDLETISFNRLSLIFWAETKYVRFCESYTEIKVEHKKEYIFNNPHKYEIDLTEKISKTYGKKYTINNIYTNFDNDRGKAFGNAVIMNAGGRFYDDFLEYNYNENPLWVIFPSNKSSFRNDIENNVNFINLSEYGQEGALHEYGHYIRFKLGLSTPFGGFAHNSNDDLALRYPDATINGISHKGMGYYAAWNEGFATFYSNLVQNYYDYSYLSSTWKKEYIDFQQLDTSGYVQFKLRESNEKTVTNVLLALCDPQFKYDDAIGVKAFFDLLKENNDVASLSDSLNVIKENIDDSMDVITKVTSYYKIAPNNLLTTITEIDDNGNTTIVEKDKNSTLTESDIPTFKWNVGNHVFYNSYLTYKDYGNGDRYTYQEALQDPSVRKHNYGLSNNDFTLYIYNSNGEELLKKENIQYEISSSKVASYTPTREEWKSVFYSSSFYCYWMVEGKDINHTYIGTIEKTDYTSEFDAQTGYTYQSEPFPFNLEKIYKEYETQTTNQNYDIDNLELSVELFTKTQTNQLPRKYEIKINYKWDEDDLPDERLTDYIVVQWNYIYNLNGTLYSVNYYDNDIIYTFDESYDGRILYYGSPYIELYYTADLRYDTNSETVSKLYGEAAIGIETTQNYDSLFVGVTYYHVLNLATVMQGIQQNEYGYYVNTSEIEKVSATYEF